MKFLMGLTLATLLSAIGSLSLADDSRSLKGPSQSQIIEMEEYNQSLLNYQLYDSSSQFHLQLKKVRPFAEYEKQGYILFDIETSGDAGTIKSSIAKNLPPGVKLVIYTSSPSLVKEIFDFVPKDKLEILTLTNATGVTFWARDGLPVPTIVLADNSVQFVDAKYFHRFESDQDFATYFKGSLVSHGFYYEGGNFMPNRLGTCIIISEGTSGTTPSDAIFEDYYGCKKMIRLPKVKGIGHIDESVKFISDNVVVTDTPEYRVPLLNAGFDVRMLPRPSGSYETYVNSLLVNGTLFMPSFNNSNDTKAIQVYQSLGLKVIPLVSTQLSQRQGSIHCITMNYPPIKK